MLRLLSEILKLPLVSSQSGSPIGRLTGYLVDPATGVIAAYVTKVDGQTRYLSTVDVLRYYDNAVLVSEPAVLQELDELVRVKRLVEERIELFGLRVVDQESARLGSIHDCLVHSVGHYLARLYVKPPLLTRLISDERIIPREHIVSISQKEVIVRYDMKAQAPAAEPEIPLT